MVYLLLRFGIIPAAFSIVEFWIMEQLGKKNMSMLSMCNSAMCSSVLYRYLVEIKPGRMLLWCYLIWYLVTVYYHFDPSVKLWLNSAGISLVIGTALILSVSSAGRGDYWQVFRLYWMPFAVSSFAALIKDKGYIVIFSPDFAEVLLAMGSCGLFVVLAVVLKWSARNNFDSTNNKPA